MQEIKCRTAPSLGDGFAGTPEQVWGTKPYNPETDKENPCVFFGLYGLPDFYALWRHKGKRWILWAGSDIRHFINGYWLEDEGRIKLDPKPLAEWISKNCESWVENEVEYETLKNIGIEAKVCPSFLGDVSKFSPQKIDSKLRYYSSVSGDDFKLYGWDKINKLAEENPHIEYHLYGNTIPWEAPPNVIVHGRVPHEVMNSEIRSMTGAIRMTEFDGCSEIIVKSVLYGQKPISLIHYDFLYSDNPREELLKIINNFPWKYE